MKGKTIGLGGDGRYFNKQAAQIIIKMAAANGVKKVFLHFACLMLQQHVTYLGLVAEASNAFVQVLVGQNAIMATPAMSALIRRRKLYGKQQILARWPARFVEKHAYSTAASTSRHRINADTVSGSIDDGALQHLGQSCCQNFVRFLATGFLSYTILHYVYMLDSTMASKTAGSHSLQMSVKSNPKQTVTTGRSLAGGLIMSASHNPGGPKEDWGIKFNYSSGEPAPERITDAIFKYTQSIKELKTADLPDIDLAKVGNNKFGSFEVTPTGYSLLGM